MDDSTCTRDIKRYLRHELALVLEEARIFHATHHDEPDAQDVVLIAALLARGEMPTTPHELFLLLTLYRHAIERSQTRQRAPHHA